MERNLPISRDLYGILCFTARVKNYISGKINAFFSVQVAGAKKGKKETKRIVFFFSALHFFFTSYLLQPYQVVLHFLTSCKRHQFPNIYQIREYQRKEFRYWQRPERKMQQQQVFLQPFSFRRWLLQSCTE